MPWAQGSRNPQKGYPVGAVVGKRCPRVLDSSVRPILFVWLATLAVAPTGQAQTGYASYSVIGPWSSSLFGPAFTSSGRFDIVATDWAGNLYAEYDGSIWKIDGQGNL